MSNWFNKVILWLCALQCVALVYVTNKASQRPFGILNMAQAYFMGCMLYVEPTIEGKDACVDAAAEFGSHLSKSMDILPE